MMMMTMMLTFVDMYNCFQIQAGYNVLLSDCDVVFLDNPFTTLITSQLQVLKLRPHAFASSSSCADCHHERRALWPPQGQD
jgi:hypothetical protein